MTQSLNHYMDKYREQLETGTIQKAYRGLFEYISSLRIHFIHKYPDNFTAGNIYHGFMDFSYFSFTPESIKNKKLKIVILFDHQKMQFEIGLFGQNKQIQQKYWQLFKNRNWNKYPLSSNAQNSIIEAVLVKTPNFDQLDILTTQIEKGTMAFAQDIMNSRII